MSSVVPFVSRSLRGFVLGRNQAASKRSLAPRTRRTSNNSHPRSFLTRYSSVPVLASISTYTTSPCPTDDVEAAQMVQLSFFTQGTSEDKANGRTNVAWNARKEKWSHLSCNILGWLAFYHHGLRNEDGNLGFMGHITTWTTSEYQAAPQRFDCCQHRFKLQVETCLSHTTRKDGHGNAILMKGILWHVLGEIVSSQVARVQSCTTIVDLASISKSFSTPNTIVNDIAPSWYDARHHCSSHLALQIYQISSPIQDHNWGMILSSYCIARSPCT